MSGEGELSLTINKKRKVSTKTENNFATLICKKKVELISTEQEKTSQKVFSRF